jgi:hypothetical protein
MKRSIIYLILSALILTSCFKEDEKVPAHDSGNLIEDEVAMGGTYSYQVYYDLSSTTSISSNEKDIYDLAFESGEEGWHVLLNTATFMYAAGTGTTNFSAPIDTTGFNWGFDKSDGDLDSTAIGNYFSYDLTDSTLIYTNEVYVLNRGYDINANLRGLKKVVIQMVSDSTYTIRYANIDGSDENTFTIEKEDHEMASLSYFSFNNGGTQIYPEPLPADYDLLFTQYTTLLYTDLGDPYPYLVTGVLVNRQRVWTVRDTTISFDEITYETASTMDFTRQLDNIGYDWKVLEGDVTGGGTPVYLIVEGLHYIIRDTEGFLYKLRFVSFYNSDGVKGYPNFEYQRL